MRSKILDEVRGDEKPPVAIASPEDTSIAETAEQVVDNAKGQDLHPGDATDVRSQP